MKRAILAALFVSLAATTGFARAGNQGTSKSPAFERFKQLEGTWVDKTGGEGMAISYKVTSGGTAVVETIGAGTKYEMVTVIHPDGDGLALTHYCMLGNQPQMRASKADITANSVAFQFVRATNMKSENDMHMHSVTYTFVDKDTLKSEWTNFDKGKPGEKAVFIKTRKK